MAISIHALLAESDGRGLAYLNVRVISIHALLAESDFMFPVVFYLENLFLSTLSLRRATASSTEATNHDSISIHALLAESDQRTAQNAPLTMSISIHALLAESDYTMTTIICTVWKFLSTLSLRRATEIGVF